MKSRRERMSLMDLGFFRRKDHYGVYLQGSVRPIHKADYRVIVEPEREKD